MHSLSSGVFLALFLASSSNSFAQNFISWDFDTNAEGWNVADMTSGGPYEPALAVFPVTHNASGGSPGGHISSTDPTAQTFAFNAPVGELGDWRCYIGGTLDFRMRCTHNNQVGEPWVLLISGSTVLVATITPPPATWMPYQIVLAPTSFFKYGGGTPSAGEFATVMSSLTGVRILADYGTGMVETSGLDSVRVSSLLGPISWDFSAGVEGWDIADMTSGGPYEPASGSFSASVPSRTPPGVLPPK